MKKLSSTARRGLVIGAAAAGLLVVGGGVAATAAFADGDDDTASTHADHDSDDRDEADEATPPLDTKVGLAEAADTAAGEVSGGTVTSVELSGTKDKPVWEVDIVTSKGTERDVTVDATSGKVVDNTADRDDHDDSHDHHHDDD
ncbi:MAG TPA: PepSY domain-containing protein [Stackebrandtia sp.]|uniref:PepSY domain-containing protein n=1 Tax=Stackebrandtia sp. TaxID=2023065 RepID=UPI002D3DA586|nr:PepSY domain-containing protein [Stackebrandtia sp.]HZE37928.1 PepSY domain-containing protein [Stackebrandtia sp.]